MSLVKEIIVDPYRRLKWGFIPVKRNVEDIIEFSSDSFKDDSTSTTSLPSEKTKDQKFIDVKVVEDVEYEYRDEANRKWWSFFNEQEYRINQKQNATNKWYHWFAEDTSYAEKKLLIKLDILLAFYSCIAYWIKYLDTVNLNNAYVSGMKEELGFKGNDLVNTQVMYTVGNIVFQIPYLFCLHSIPLNYVLPFLDICWSLLTIGAAYVNSVSHLKAIRFFIGAFEAPSYLAYQYLFGSFYKHDEMVRRSAFYYLGQYIGVLSAGGIQSAVYESLDGRNGLSGWRWNFIIDAIVSIVVGIIGFYSLPGDPHNCYSIFLTDDEIRLARKRVKENQTANTNLSDKLFDLKIWKRIIFDWKIYILTLWNVFCWNNNNGSSGAYLLWLKSLKRYSIPKLNKLSMITPGLGMIYLIGTSFVADKFHSRWLAIIITQIFNFTGNVILAVWDVEEGAKWFAFMLQYFGWAMAPVLYSWQNDICRRDVHSRAVILVVMNMLAQTSTAWINVLVWKTSEAPRFPKGFIWVAVASFCLSIWTFVVLYFYKRDEKRNAKDNGIIIYNSAKGETPEQFETQES
ncbi:hypothetical protein RI543_000987 [Arxiozyma heterogenica]|uniref:Transporter SEO1 n=1 Tax=Arxiozyma heterogenica TaxID=278026 RepID=A0AAN8A9J6_9SACH|nr:hypothetical protein RI543_000987 [Kazachstania heterogenica]